ncbi:MAG: low-specificity L-threonine aldolase [Desulfobacteraceae bacterium]|jgi:threonine aldolase
MIDLRSDTVTKPSQAMRAVMIDAEVGDDVYGEDPTVNRLEEIGAGLAGTEAAIFAPSGTQSNLLALMTHCTRGDEYIVGQTAHTYKYEGGGAAVLGSVQPQPLDFEVDGTLGLGKVAQAIKPADFHFARTVLLCLENTNQGLALPPDYFPTARRFADTHHLKLHLDGARIFNAAVKCGIPAAEMAQHFDSVSICLSKGLGAPVGSLLCSTREFVSQARRWRKMLGGGMRQAGMLAAAGIFALENNIQRLEQDHHNAGLLAQGLHEIEELQVDDHPAQTNMVFFEYRNKPKKELASALKEQGILINGGQRVRLVTHMDLGSKQIRKTVDAMKAFFLAW